MEDDFGDLEQDLEASAKWVALLMTTILLIAWGAVAFAAPRAENEQECSVAADMAAVARALAEERIEPLKAELIMRRIYEVSPPRGEDLLREIIDAAYRERDESGNFAARLVSACMVTGGDMDGVLGVKL